MQKEEKKSRLVFSITRFIQIHSGESDESQSMMFTNNFQMGVKDSDDDTNDPTAPFYELQSFTSIWDALRWEQIRTRIPICFGKTIRSRYMLANLFYLCYTIGILIIDFNPTVNQLPSSNDDVNTNSSMDTTTVSPLDGPVNNPPIANRLFIVFAIVHMISASLYCWSWRDRSWFDIILIPEYLNHIEAVLYLWSAIWYSKQVTLGDFYTISTHKVEMAAATIEVAACVGW